MNTTNSARGGTRTAAITGAGGGLGRELSLQLAAQGYRVYGTARNAEEISDLADASDGAVRLSLTDITSAEQVAAWTREVSAETGEHGLDLLISNAGILTPGPMEVLPLEEVRREFEVNVFGGLAVINALLPALRTAQGRIVLIGAMSGRFPFPYNGPSSATKAALGAFADVYRNELRPFGVDVVLAEAGNLRTGGPAKTAAALQRTADAMTPGQRELYGEAFARFAERLNRSQAGGLSVEESARQVLALAQQTPAKARGPIGPDAARVLGMIGDLDDEQMDQLRAEMTGAAS